MDGSGLPPTMPPEPKPAAPRTGAAAAIGATRRGTPTTAPTARQAVVPGLAETQPAACDGNQSAPRLSCNTTHTRQPRLPVCLVLWGFRSFFWKNRGGRGGGGVGKGWRHGLVLWTGTYLRGGTRSSLGQILTFLCNSEQGGALVLSRDGPFGGRDACLCDGPEGVHDARLLWLVICCR